MRTTTELTARFALEITTMPAREHLLNCDAPIGSLEYWEAAERDYAREDVDLLDALDFDTVPFEQVEADLSVELFEQDLAEDREIDFYNYEEDFDRSPEHHDTWEKRQHRIAARRERRNRISAALLRAKELYPHMNWAPLIGLHNAGWDVLDKHRI